MFRMITHYWDQQATVEMVDKIPSPGDIADLLNYGGAYAITFETE